MKKLTIALLTLCTCLTTYAQTDNQELIRLGKAYKNFMFRNDPAKEDLKELKSGMPDHMKTAGEFIIQTLTRAISFCRKPIYPGPTTRP